MDLKARVMRVMDLCKFVSFLEPCGYAIYLLIDMFFKSCFKTYISGELSSKKFPYVVEPPYNEGPRD